MKSRTELEQRIEATRREIERLKNLPPRKYTRRVGSGNPRLADIIARQERYLDIDLKQLADLEQVEHDNTPTD